jgi:hypothetical protein
MEAKAEPKDFDHQASLFQRLLRKKGLRLLWFGMLLVIAVFQVTVYLRLEGRGVVFFHSRLEMVLVVALVIVFLLGVVVKNQLNR